MKDQVNRLARGEFCYEVPEVTLSENVIERSLPCNGEYTGSFRVYSRPKAVKGVCYSTNEKVVVLNDSFLGVENTIEFRVKTGLLEPDEVLEGAFCLVTAGGELTLPYTLKIVRENIATAMGDAQNLYHFANLVRTEPEVAMKLFLSEEFESVFIGEDCALQALYKALRQSPAPMLAMEEFLISVRKKKPVTLSIGEEKKEYGGLTENIKDAVVVCRDGWGYFEYQVKSDAPFLCIEEDALKSERFAGNKYELEYVVDVSRMHGGFNWGKITISGPRQVLECTICAWRSILDTQGRSLRKRDLLELMHRYLSFRTGKIPLNRWLETSGKLAGRLIGTDERDVFAWLAHAQLKIAAGQKKEAAHVLDAVRETVLGRTGEDRTYCYYLYLRSLLGDEEVRKEKNLESVREKFDQNPSDWRIFWILSHMDPMYEQNRSLKLASFKSLYYKGCKSPMMYFEAASCFNEQPYLLRLLDEFEVQVLIFACKYGMLHENLLKQVCDIYETGKVKGMAAFRLMEKLYAAFPQERELALLCSLIIRMEIRDKKYLPILEAGIAYGLRIARIYETYVETRNETDDSLLPRTVLLYFSYNNALDAGCKAALYANIIKNKERDEQTYQTYRKLMEVFAMEQMDLGNVSQNLALIYKEFWQQDPMNETYAMQMNRFLFSYRLCCDQENIAGVVVCHKELSLQTTVPIIRGIAYVMIYTDNCNLVFVDEEGRRYAGSVQYRLERLMAEGGREDECGEALIGKNLYFDLYLLEKALRYRYPVKNQEALMTSLYKRRELSSLYRREVARAMVVYYYERYDGQDFREIYARLVDEEMLGELRQKDGLMLVETCVIHGMYAEAMALVRQFGCEKLYPPRLMRLCKSYLEEWGRGENALLCHMCKCSFDNKKYENTILEYLVAHYNGSSEEMIKIWEAAVNFDVEPYELEERLLAQLLFARSASVRMEEIFESYYKKGARERIVEAFLSYHAYRYFVKKVIPKENVMTLVQIRLEQGKEALDIWKIALLKHYSDASSMTGEEKALAARLLKEMCAKKLIFGFYKKFSGIVPLPFHIIDKTYIEYRTNPRYRVSIHYRKENGEEDGAYRTEEMANVYEGVFVKEVVLFYGESVQYYITEKNGEEENITESKSVVNKRINPDFSEGRFEYINDMLSCQELCDMVTLRKLMHGYGVKQYASEQLFRPM